MFRARSVQSVCTSCRLSSVLLRARCARLPVQIPVGPPQERLSGPRRPAARRPFSATPLQRQVEQEPAADSEDGPLVPAEELSAEANARKARQRFGDALPRDYLSADAYTVYKRLYGTPVFIDHPDDLQGLESSLEKDIIEERRPDGSTVLLGKDENGALVEIDLSAESEPLEENEEIEPAEETMTAEEWEALREQKAQAYHDAVYERSRLSQEAEEEAEAEALEVEPEEDDFMRAHPLTVAGRSKPLPSTVFLPKAALVDPTAVLLTRANHKHLTESVHRIFGGPGLPYSASTPSARLGKEQKPIPLDLSRRDMGNIEADAYMAAVQPSTYASIMGALVEVRRRLGSSWLEHLLRTKKGGTVLDAGSGGVGVLAWHEALQAEWQRMHEDSGNTSKEATPLGKATVLAASDTLRHRASKLLENTTFIPRLPDAVAEDEEVNTQQPRKLYDLIIAPHTLWSIRQDYMRAEQVGKYWSLLNPKGGVLILIEKGLPRGFEVIAGARSHLLDKYISSPGSDTFEASLESQVSEPEEDTRLADKETGMIIAPCTNHSTCPMYQSPGISQGRKDFCFFSQRYIRPPYLQRILNATDRNHEDIQYSYIAVQRGRDQRLPEHDILGKGFVQSKETTDAAFEGHEWTFPSGSDSEAGSEAEEPVLKSIQDVNPLTFPRLILPALKRRGHIILDVCTPAGTLERWTVPRSFSKQAFRDARKARWGDLWALGAKTRIPRSVRLGRPSDEYDKKGRRIKQPKKVVIEIGVGEKDGVAAEVGKPRILGRRGKSQLGDRDSRYNSDRKIRGSGGRKGRRKSNDYDDLDDL